MIEATETYLAVRRTAGFSLTNAEYLLRSFAKFAAARGLTHVHVATVIDWASEPSSVAQRHARYQTVGLFARYVQQEDARHELLPPNYFGYRKTRRVPHIYTMAEIDRLILAARQLPAAHSLQASTYATLISLLAATGLRISEALGLLLSDITDDGLLIRKSKFKKTRLLPLHPTAAMGLDRYLTARRRVRCRSQHVFLSECAEPLSYSKVHAMFVKLLKSANVLPSQGRRPRLNELRHTFAVRALESSPAGRQRVGRHMVALATYMGHTNCEATHWYLESTPELMQDIADAGEHYLWGRKP